MIKIMRIIERNPAPNEHDDCPDFEIDDQIIEDIGFRDLVEEMRRFTYPSTSHPSGSIYEWLMTNPEPDYRTGDVIHESLHFHHENQPRAAKYWRKAMKAAGLVRFRGSLNG